MLHGVLLATEHISSCFKPDIDLQYLKPLEYFDILDRIVAQPVLS